MNKNYLKSPATLCNIQPLYLVLPPEASGNYLLTANVSYLFAVLLSNSTLSMILLNPPWEAFSICGLL